MSAQDGANSKRELVFVLHGFGSNRIIMTPLARRIGKAGYRVRNWGYPSLLRRTDDHAQRLHESLLKAVADDNIERVHIVGHSMGGIVARRALQLGIPAKFGRLVMLAPPNRGSRYANPWASSLGRVIQPIAELCEHEESFVNRLAPPEGVEFGVIAASADMMVRRDCTHLTGECDYLVIPASHTILCLRRQTAEQAVTFLRTGRFARAETKVT